MATMQAVLLYGSKMWNVAPASIKRPEGFHVCATWQMASKRPARNEDGFWAYLCSKEVQLAVGLKTIAHYVGVRCQTITDFIVN